MSDIKQDIYNCIMRLAKIHLDFPITQEKVNEAMTVLYDTFPGYGWTFETNTENTIGRITFYTEDGDANAMVFGDASSFSPEDLIEACGDLPVKPESFKVEQLEEDKVTLH